MRSSFFVWLIVPLLLWGGYALYGLPHAIWSYEYQGRRHDFAGRWYTRCTFVGPYGAFTTYPTDGKCPWLAFFKPKDAGQ